VSNVRYEKVTSHWSQAAGLVLRRAASLAEDRAIDVVTLVAALDSDVPPRTTTTLRLDLGASGVLRAADDLRIRADRSHVNLVDLVAALADAAFTHPDPDLVRLRRPLTEHLLALTGGSRRAAGGVVTIADVFGRKPSSLVSR